MYRGSLIDDLIETVKLAENHVCADAPLYTKKTRANVQAYAMYINEYFRPEGQIQVNEVA